MVTAALVLAAGQGKRLGLGEPKGFVQLEGRTLVERSVNVFCAVAAVDWIQPVLPKGMEADWEKTPAHAMAGVLRAIPGGKERQESVELGLQALPPDVELVAVHDAARCLVTVQEVERVLDVGRRTGAALLACPATDTMKRVRQGAVIETPDRSECWIAQTPQVFQVALLRRALADAKLDGFVGTDDSQLVERLGHAVQVVQGSADNFKITRPGDLDRAAQVLTERGDA